MDVQHAIAVIRGDRQIAEIAAHHGQVGPRGTDCVEHGRAEGQVVAVVLAANHLQRQIGRAGDLNAGDVGARANHPHDSRVGQPPVGDAFDQVGERRASA